MPLAIGGFFGLFWRDVPLQSLLVNRHRNVGSGWQCEHWCGLSLFPLALNFQPFTIGDDAVDSIHALKSFESGEEDSCSAISASS